MGTNDLDVLEANDCKSLFRQAYENRYTWDTDFKGYTGCCVLDDGISIYKGSFCLGRDMKVAIEDIDNEEINQLISSQLWEVAIHRVRRKFDVVHKDNSFTVGNITDVGLEVLVGGKNLGDKYIIKDNIIKMVHRHIHGSLVNIFTIDTLDTGNGYLSSIYTSQYLEPFSNNPKTGISKISDEFISLEHSGLWTLSSRVIETNAWGNIPYSKKKFIFSAFNENH